MEKRLSVVGNSLALVIEKPIRDLLGISRDTRLAVTTDGRRLVIEPIFEDPASKALASEQIDIAKVMHALVMQYDLSRERFQRLHHGGTRLMAYMGHVTHGVGARSTDPQDLATMRRLAACLKLKHQGADWDTAIAGALAAEPIDQRPTNQTASAIAEARMIETQPQIT